MKRLAKYVSLVLLFAAILTAGGTSLALAGTNNDSGLNSLTDLVNDAIGVVNTVIILLTAVCVVVFIVGLIRFVFNNGADAKKTGRDYMIYSVIAFAVLTALFALANFLTSLFVDDEFQNAPYNVPQFGNNTNG